MRRKEGRAQTADRGEILLPLLQGRRPRWHRKLSGTNLLDQKN